MTTPKSPESSTATTNQQTLFGDEIQTPAKIIPPQPAKPKKGFSAATLAARLRWFDRVLLALVLVLAFFLGSFVAQNTDLFMHLGLRSPFGADADPSGWVHHAWLPSVMLRVLYDPYAATGAGDGRWAVVAKALVVVAIAIVLCITRRRGQSLVLPIACAALTLVAISPRLTMQPMVISMLLVGLTLFVLTLPAAHHPRAIWWLPVLFVLWVNMDQWFFLGPVLVALWLLGECLPSTSKGKTGSKGPRRTQLAAVLVVGLVCCILNPWGYRAFQLPVEFAYPFVDVLPHGVVGAGQTVARIRESDPQYMPVLSPFSSKYVTSPTLGRHVGGWAYFVLFFLGLASFAIRGFSRSQESSAKEDDSTNGAVATGSFTTKVESFNAIPLVAIFAFFGLLSVYHYRLIAWFAIIAGPIIALNLQDWLNRNRVETKGVSRFEFNWAVLGRGAVLLMLLVLLACAWPGWLFSYVQDWRGTRHVDWLVRDDPGVMDAARVVGEIQRKTGLCKLGCNYAVEGGNQFTWSSARKDPQVSLMCDARYALFTDRADAYGKIRKALQEEAEQFYESAPRDRKDRQDRLNKLRLVGEGYRAPMRQFGVDYIVVTHLHQEPKALMVVDCMLVDPFRQWVLLYHDGRTAIFGWIDPDAPRGNEAYRAYQLDFNTLSSSKTMPPNLPRVLPGASTVAPLPEDTSSEWFQYFYGPPRPALSSFQSARYVGIFELAQNDWERRSIDFLIGSGGIAFVSASNISVKGPIRALKDAKGQIFTERLFTPKDFGPPAALILAVRAARKAAVESANDVTAHLNLVQAYQLLQVRQEDHWSGRPPLDYQPYKPSLRHQLRRMQIGTALHAALAANPENPPLLGAMFDWYLELNYFDVAVDYLIQAKSVQDRLTAANFGQLEAAKQMERHVKAVTDELKRRYDDYALAITERTDVLGKFETALVDRSKKAAESGEVRRGLIKLGQQILRDAKPEDFKNEPAKLAEIWSWEIYLMLTTGQAREAYELFGDKSLTPMLSGEQFELLRGLAAAVLGDYVSADKHLDQAEKALKLPSDEQIHEQQREPARKLAQNLASVLGWLPIMDGYPLHLSRMAAFNDGQVNIMKGFTQLIKERHHAAELRMVRGLLALEAGDTTSAVKHFQGCLSILPIGIDFPDRRVAQRYLEVLEAK